MRRLPILIFLLASPGLVYAQSAVSGKYMIEPLVGLHYWITGSRFDGPDGSMPVFGGRITWRRSYSQSVLLEATTGSTSTSWRSTWDGGGYFERRSNWRRTVALLGVGSTLVDRDATGDFGIHSVAAVGFLADPYEIRTTERISSDQNPTVHVEDGLAWSACLSLGIQMELEVFSPRLLLRGSTTMLIGFAPGAKYHEAIWLPGFAFTGGIAASL